MNVTTGKIIIGIFLICLILISGCNAMKSVGQAICKGLDLCPVQPSAEPSSKAMVFSVIKYMLPLGVLGIGAGMFLITQKQLMWGLGAIVSCVAILVITVALIEKLGPIAWIGAGIIVAVIVFAMWQVWLQRKALEQTTITVEKAKEEMDNDQKAAVFGTSEKDHGLAGKVQSKTTEKIIKKIRNTFKLDTTK